MSDSIEQLKTLVQQDISDLEQLNQVLIQEKQLLATRDVEQIKRISSQKDALVKQVETRAKQKAKLLATSGLGIKPGNVTATLETYGDQQLLTSWKASLELLDQCKRRNEVNGAIITRSQHRTAKLMTIIRGQNATPSLYGQKGKQSIMSGRQTLGRA